MTSGDYGQINIAEFCQEFQTINKIVNLGIVLRERKIKDPIWLKKQKEKGTIPQLGEIPEDNIVEDDDE